MAELVEYHMESALPEYEQMQILNLFTNEEILKMKKAREKFEYRISRPSRDIKDFVEYIKYERSVISLTKQRTKIQKPNASHTIGALIAKRMKELYRQALALYPHNVRFWDEYFKFLQQCKFTKDISATFDQMLQFHSDKPEVWIRAILWEYNENYSDERVKGLLLRAQQLHPAAPKLYLTFFQIELENKRAADECLALQHATVVYTNGKEKFTNFTFFNDMLNIVDKFSYANAIQELILNDMREKFYNEDIMWHTFAQRELMGLTTGNFFKSIRGEDDDSGGGGGGSGGGGFSANTNTFDHSNSSVNAGVSSTNTNSNAADSNDDKMNGKHEDDEHKLNVKNIKCEDALPPLRKRIEACMQIYEESIKVINTAKMASYYLNAMIELNTNLTVLPTLKRYALTKAFAAANNSDQISETHYLQYIELLYSNNPKDETIEKLFEKAIKMYKSSERIWLQYIRYHICENSFKKLREIFETARHLLESRAAEIWYVYLMYLRTLQTSEANAEFDTLIKELAQQPHDTFNNLKAYMLEHIAISMSMKRARKIYKLFINHCPGAYEVHEMMAELESKQLKRDVDAERRCLEMMILNFGKLRTDVWLRFMRFERNVGIPKYISRLHQNALATLNPELLDDFSAQYNFFSHGTL